MGNADITSVVRALDRIAKRHGITKAQAAIAWLLAHSPAMLPIPGTADVRHLKEDLAAAAVKLTPEDIQEL